MYVNLCHIYLYIDTNINLYIQPEPGNLKQIIKKNKGIQLKKDKCIFKKMFAYIQLRKTEKVIQ